MNTTINNPACTYFDTDFCMSHHTEGNKDTDRHYRMLNHLSSLFKNNFFSNARWLTVGDGLGREAIFLKKQGVEHVTATDVWYANKNLTKIAEFVDDAQQLDISKSLEFKTDFILGKEVLHHLKRPLNGLYNLLDAASKGVVFIEPQDFRYNTGSWNFTEDSFLLSDQDADDWEKAGNYKYCFSIREICKMAWADEAPHVMVTGFNDATGDLYDPPLEQSNKEKYAEYIKRCKKLDELGRANLRPFNIVVCMIVKEQLDTHQLDCFKNFKVINNPKL